MWYFVCYPGYADVVLVVCVFVFGKCGVSSWGVSVFFLSFRPLWIYEVTCYRSIGYGTSTAGNSWMRYSPTLLAFLPYLQLS